MVATDRRAYLAGEPVTITGRDFAPGESVSVQVTHADGTAEAGMGHDTSMATAGADGKFRILWTPNGSDIAGPQFVAAASGDLSGTVAPAVFVRISLLTSDKGDYQPGETAVLAGHGFAPGEVVQVQVTHANGLVDGNGHDPFYVSANETGDFTTTWFVNPDDSLGSKFNATATGVASAVVGSTSFWDAGSVSLTVLGAAYTQNFNTLATSGTTNTSLPTGWDLFETGTSTRNNGAYAASTGSDNAGDVYSFGAANDPERAYGTLLSGTLTPTIGAQFTNNTGGTITSLAISYTGEMWRAGFSNRGSADRLDFQYSATATSLTTGTWTDVDGLDFNSPNLNASAGALNGNAAGNRTQINATISGLSIPSGATFWIRWRDFDISNSDDGLAIDDFSLTPFGFTDQPPSVSSTVPASGASDVALSQNVTVTFSEPVNVSGSWFSLSCTTSGAHTATVSGGPSTFTLDPDTNFANSETCTLTVYAAQVTDQDSNDPPDTMTADFVTSFATTGPDSAPSVASTLPANGATNVAVNQNITVTFSEPVNVVDPWFTLSCGTSGAHAAAVTGGPTSFTLDPSTDFAYGETCTLVIDATKVTDQDSNDPPDSMVANFTASFATEADPCTLPFTPAYQIQGSGLTAAITGPVTTQGVVVGDYEGTSSLGGFYLQDVTGDGNDATSDGIFVFNAGNNVSLGDVVRVTGSAQEFQGMTEVASVTSLRKCGTGSIRPVDVTLPVASSTYLERYEGMLVRLPQTLYVTEHFQLGRFGQVVLSSGGRLKQPTNIFGPGAQANALQAANNLNRIILDDALQTQNPDPIAFARGGAPLSASNTLRGGDTATGIIGILDYTWGGNSASPNAYRVRPLNALSGVVNFQPTNPRPAQAPSVGGTVKVVGMNLLNFFNTFTNCTFGVGGAPADCRGADTQAEFDRQWPKTVAAIVAMNPDVLGVNELENDGYGPTSALQFLVDKLNAATAPGTYAFIDVDANTEQTNALGTDAIRVAMLYKPAIVTATGQTAVLNTVAFVNGGDNGPRNRPSLAQAFRVNGTGAVFIVDVNHLKSKGSACNTPDAGDLQGNCNQVRVNAATELMNWLASDPTGTGDPDVLLIGDYNSYAQEDPIAAIKNAGYTNLIESRLGPDAYSYVFDGQWGYLDHALASLSLVAQVTGVGDYHINADEPSVLDYNTNFKTANLQTTLYAPDQFRVSDHDPVVIGLIPNAPPTVNAGGPYAVNEGSSITLTANGSDPNGDALTYAWDLDNDGTFETSGQSVTFSAASLDGPGTQTVKVRVSDPGGLSAVASTTVTVNNVNPTVASPVVTPEPSLLGASVTASATFSDPHDDAPYMCTVNYGDGSAALQGTVSGNSCSGPSHVYSAVGAYTVTVTVTDKDGGTGTSASTHAVIYAFSGFFQPVDNPPVLNQAPAGVGIPVKFSLGGDQGLNIFAAGYPKSDVVVCDTSAVVDGIEETVTAGSSGLTFNALTGQYTYVWKTNKSWAGTCRQLVVKLVDGTSHRANFKFVK